jgi:hypothetical protein
MVLARCKDQGTETLDAFYEGFAKRGTAVGTDGRAMLDLFAALQMWSDTRQVWGLTSLAALYLLSSDDSSSPRYVKVLALSYGGYEIEYLMPAEIAPWPQAWVRGEAATVHDAVRMLGVAMDRSGGWATGPTDT